MGNMLQYGVWANCTGCCKFCLREEKKFYTREKQLLALDSIKKNIPLIDWEDKFDYGISLLGGELYAIKDPELQESFLDLIDIIIEKILKVSKNPFCKYSTVTNGVYDPTFLYKVIDKIVDAVGIDKVDMNFSCDLKYRYRNEDEYKTVIKNINEFHTKYNYAVGVQMILTQYLIDMWKDGTFDVNKFIDEVIPGNNLNFLYPHPVRTGIALPDFFFKRRDFLKFIAYLKKANEHTYRSFLHSTKNSATFKWTGLRNRRKLGDYTQMPELTDGKEIINEECGHSILYKCYSDCDKCMLCDLRNMDEEMYL